LCVPACIAVAQVTQHPECVIRITITHATSAGATPTAAEMAKGGPDVWFKLNGVAVASYTDDLPRTELEDSLPGKCDIDAATSGG
jgi:hypothetical protein